MEKTRDISTEEKIRQAAEKEFMKKGFAAARIRDIAANAGINLALLNYYFRSKEKLFELVMAEKVERLFALILPVLNDKGTSLQQKLVLISEHYTQMLLDEPSLPSFVISEMQQQPEKFAGRIRFSSEIMQSEYIAQLKNVDPNTNPLDHLVSYLGILIFPYLMRPVLAASGTLDEKTFKEQIEKRKKMAPIWMGNILGLNSI